jgi:dUTPase
MRKCTNFMCMNGKEAADAEGACVYITCRECGGTGFVPDLVPPLCRLEEMFERQKKFMELLIKHDRMPEFPVDLTTKQGQRLIKEYMFNTVEELMEASFTLKNRMHRITDARALDIDHYKEELGDAFAFFMEICILSGFTAEEMYQEYTKKNAVVTGRLENGY